VRIYFGDLLFVDDLDSNFESRLFMDRQLDSTNRTSANKIS
jgi:hypothetical protein